MGWMEVCSHSCFQAQQNLTCPFPNHPEDPRLKPWNVSHRHVLHLPTVFHHLPHLLAKESSLQPAVRVGQGRTGGMGVAREGREAGRKAVPGALSSVTPPRPCSVRGDGHSKREARGALVPD